MKKVSLQDLVGRKIVKVNDDCCNAVTIDTEDGRTFMLDTERVFSNMDVYGITAWERSSNEDNES